MEILAVLSAAEDDCQWNLENYAPRRPEGDDVLRARLPAGGPERRAAGPGLVLAARAHLARLLRGVVPHSSPRVPSRQFHSDRRSDTQISPHSLHFDFFARLGHAVLDFFTLS